MSLFAFDPEQEQQLNDIDEYIREQCGDDLTVGFNRSDWIMPLQAGEAIVVHSRFWNIKGRSGNFILLHNPLAKNVYDSGS